MSQAEPSTAGRPPMIGTTEPSSPTASPVSVEASGILGGAGKCPALRGSTGASSSSGGVDPVASFSVTLAISFAAHTNGPARKPWPSLPAGTGQNRLRLALRQSGYPPGAAPN